MQQQQQQQQPVSEWPGAGTVYCRQLSGHGPQEPSDVLLLDTVDSAVARFPLPAVFPSHRMLLI